MTAVTTAQGHQVFRPLAPDKRADLAKSIKASGVLFPILVDQHGQIIDGHHRKAIADEIGADIEVRRIEVRDDAHAAELALEANLHQDNGRADAMRRDTEYRAEVVIKCRARGMTQDRIAEVTGLTRDEVRAALVGAAVQFGETPELQSPERVEGADGKSYPAFDRSPAASAERRARADEMRRSGASVPEIAADLGVSDSAVYQMLRECGWRNGAPPEPDPAPETAGRDKVAAKYERVAEMASQGYTSQQIAAAIGMSHQGLKQACRSKGIEIPADAIARPAPSDSNRIVESTVRSMEGIATGLRLVRPADLDPDRMKDWVDSLTRSMAALTRLHKEMKGMTQ